MDKLWLGVKIAITLLVVILLVQNFATVEVRFLVWGLSLPLALLLMAVYLLGMVSGKSLLGAIRRLRRNGQGQARRD
ncbi:lipopolysaccharide assembly protein LapA domain-containing protein [Halomonas sp. BM-2019]|uniref:lipopolysaccharide assembly protein LapA domain-containing protein n=1 Tax=Halomonas sp. BM-2019 TaxID=2811227 RepID=UPI001B3C2442|nr:MAG: DUF1049 domain-containing protein [Halomonas sp. BM-2019]